MIGLVTPPVGLVLYMSTSMAKTRFEEVVREIIPFLIALIAVLILCTFIPAIVLWLPNLLIK
jgi:TRAP-type C4-dicarboxylate transport system permease large subunit